MILAASLKDLLDYLGLTLSLSAAASVACLFLPACRKQLRRVELILPGFFVAATLLSAGLLVARDPWQALGTVLTVALACACMALLAAVTRRRIGERLMGNEGRAQIDAADAWMSSQGVGAPERMAAMYAPGFEKSADDVGP